MERTSCEPSNLPLLSRLPCRHRGIGGVAQQGTCAALFAKGWRCHRLPDPTWLPDVHSQTAEFPSLRHYVAWAPIARFGQAELINRSRVGDRQIYCEELDAWRDNVRRFRKFLT